MLQQLILINFWFITIACFIISITFSAIESYDVNGESDVETEALNGELEEFLAWAFDQGMILNDKVCFILSYFIVINLTYALICCNDNYVYSNYDEICICFCKHDYHMDYCCFDIREDNAICRNSMEQLVETHVIQPTGRGSLAAPLAPHPEASMLYRSNYFTLSGPCWKSLISYRWYTLDF